MTIALGVLATDGIVLAADTEVSWGDRLKTDGTKITKLTTGGAIAGSGHIPYMEALVNEVEEVIIDDQSDNLKAIQQKIGRVLVRFHREHVPQPWPNHDFNVALLIALQREGRRALWATDMGTIRPCSYAAIGIGSPQAHAKFGDFFEGARHPEVNLQMAKAIAAYVITQVKNEVPGCGKRTDIATITQGLTDLLSSSTSRLIESQIDELLQLQVRATQFALGYILTDDVTAEAEHLAKFFVTAREHVAFAAGAQSDSSRWTLGTTLGELAVSGHPPTVDITPSVPLVTAPARRGPKRGRKGPPPSPESRGGSGGP